MLTITLRRAATCWVAEHSGDDLSVARLMDLFGSTSLPTAWTPQADAEDVRREIAALNPGATVTVAR